MKNGYFYHWWVNYVKGFGNLSGEFWLGLSKTEHNGIKFSTYDRDNEEDNRNCASQYEGAWWYHYCHTSNLNGRYLSGTTTSYADGVVWQHWKVIIIPSK